MEILLRTMTNNDFEFVYESLCNLENATLNKQVLARIFQDNSQNTAYYYLLAYNEQQPLGFLTLHTQNLLHHEGLVGEIQELYVIPEMRGQGVGRKLVEEVKRYADANDFKSLEVATNRKRTANVAIYEGLGFTLSHHKFTIYK